jgi:hypothetical protein
MQLTLYAKPIGKTAAQHVLVGSRVGMLSCVLSMPPSGRRGRRRQPASSAGALDVSHLSLPDAQERMDYVGSTASIEYAALQPCS